LLCHDFACPAVTFVFRNIPANLSTMKLLPQRPEIILSFAAGIILVWERRAIVCEEILVSVPLLGTGGRLH